MTADPRPSPPEGPPGVRPRRLPIFGFSPAATPETICEYTSSGSAVIVHHPRLQDYIHCPTLASRRTGPWPTPNRSWPPFFERVQSHYSGPWTLPGRPSIVEHVQEISSEATMDTVGIYLLYLFISVGLTIA